MLQNINSFRWMFMAILVLLLSRLSPAQGLEEKDAEKLNRIESEVEKFIQTKQKQLDSLDNSLIRQIDGRIRQIKNSELPTDIKRARIHQINTEKDRLKATGQFPTCDELLDITISHANRSQKLMEAIESRQEGLANAAIDNLEKQAIEQKLLELEQRVEQLLGSKARIQTGDKWSGTREHPNGSSSLMLNVLKAEGDFFEGELHQTYPSRSTDIMRIAGERKGHLILMKTNGMYRGKQRNLQFQGYLIGDRIITSVEGITTEGKQATGWISLSRK